MQFIYDVEKAKTKIEKSKAIAVRDEIGAAIEVRCDDFIVKEDGIHMGIILFKKEDYGHKWYLSLAEYNEDYSEWVRSWGSLD